jgi:hypothetical protein
MSAGRRSGRGNRAERRPLGDRWSWRVSQAQRMMCSLSRRIVRRGASRLPFHSSSRCTRRRTVRRMTWLITTRTGRSSQTSNWARAISRCRAAGYCHSVTHSGPAISRVTSSTKASRGVQLGPWEECVQFRMGSPHRRGDPPSRRGLASPGRAGHEDAPRLRRQVGARREVGHRTSLRLRSGLGLKRTPQCRSSRTCTGFRRRSRPVVVGPVLRQVGQGRRQGQRRRADGGSACVQLREHLRDGCRPIRANDPPPTTGCRSY